MDAIIILIVRVLLGVLSAVIARSKGRSTVGWFFGGFIIGLIGIIIVLCLGDLRKEREFKKRTRNQNRRLREKLRQEKLKNESFRGHAKERLDRHDQALGMDTRDAGGRLRDPDDPEQLPADQHREKVAKGEWYFTRDDRVYGPVEREKLLRLFENGKLDDASMVRREGMDNWKQISKIPGLV